MAIQIDPASPALAVGTDTTTITTASFTRPVDGLLVALVAAVSESAPTVSGGSFTWTRRVQRAPGTDYAEIWTAPVTGSGSVTVTLGVELVEGAGASLGALKVVGITGQHPTDPIGNTGNNTATTNTLNVTGYTSSGVGSRGFLAALDSNGLGSPTAGGGDTGYPFSETVGGFFEYSGLGMVKADNTAGSGTSVTFNADAPGSSSAQWAWAALEILAAPVPPRTVALRPTGAAHRAASW
ncbi:hypothetical protein [Streptomyces sp.]|uniref:hypothetical protein n=1 Tax=Streptomyces sp. TaxID=1931 RepID=UPI002F91CCB9